MKKQISMTVHNNYNYVFKTGYCNLSKICKHIEPQYYNSGVYGWNCDVYVDNQYSVMISTGYRNMRGTTIPSHILKKYDDIARSIINNKYSYEKECQLLEENYNNFLQELVNCK